MPANETMHDERQTPQEAASARANMLSSTEFGLFLSCSSHHKLPPIQRKSCRSMCNNKRCHMHGIFQTCAEQKKFSSYRFSQTQQDLARTTATQKRTKPHTLENDENHGHDDTDTCFPHKQCCAQLSTRTVSIRTFRLDNDAPLTPRVRNVPRHSACPAHLLRWQSRTVHKPATMKRT